MRKEGGDGAFERDPTLFDRKRMLQTVAIVLVLVGAIYFLLPKIVGLDDALGKLDQGDPFWIAVAFVFSHRDPGRLHRALPRRRRGERHPPRVEGGLRDLDGELRRQPHLRRRRRGRDRAHLLGAPQGGHGAAPDRPPHGRLPRPALHDLPRRPRRLRDPAAHRRAAGRRAARPDDRARRDRRRADRRHLPPGADPGRHGAPLRGLERGPPLQRHRAPPGHRPGHARARHAHGARVHPPAEEGRAGADRRRRLLGRATSARCGRRSRPSTSTSPSASSSRATSSAWSPT